MYDPSEAQSRVVAAGLSEEVPTVLLPPVGQKVSFKQFVPDMGLITYAGSVEAADPNTKIVRVRLSADEKLNLPAEQLEWDEPKDEVEAKPKNLDPAESARRAWAAAGEPEYEVVGEFEDGKWFLHPTDGVTEEQLDAVSKKLSRKMAESNGNIEGRNNGYYVLNADGSDKSGPYPTWDKAMDASRSSAPSEDAGGNAPPTNQSDFDATDHFVTDTNRNASVTAADRTVQEGDWVKHNGYPGMLGEVKKSDHNSGVAHVEWRDLPGSYDPVAHSHLSHVE
jgi:hypothetical protein